jgi:hypothetical protein
MFFYWAYGLEIVSELEFPEMYPYAVKKPNLEIKLGSVPAVLTGPEVIAKEKFFISPTEYLIHLPICSYYVKEGASITIELRENADLPFLPYDCSYSPMLWRLFCISATK